jgi:hypothetical protein
MVTAIFFTFSCVLITQETFTATLAKFDTNGDYIYMH